MPRFENRAPSVSTGIASQQVVGTRGPPVRAMLAAMISSETSHAASSAYSGRSKRSMRRSRIRNTITAAASGSSVHQPSHGPDATSAIARTPNARDRTGRNWASSSSIRSLSAPSGKSHDVRLITFDYRPKEPSDMRENHGSGARPLRRGTIGR
jgi:hypothetical protein